MASRMLVVFAFVGALAVVCSAQTCPCLKEENAQCARVIATGGSTCDVETVECDKCFCDFSGSADLECETVERVAFLPTEVDGQCADRTITFARCPPPAEPALWRVGSDSCENICGSESLACNAGRTNELNALALSDQLAFRSSMLLATGTVCSAVAFCNPAGLCPNSGPALFGTQCGYDLNGPSTCKAEILGGGAFGGERVCCCGPDDRCPLATR
mmetsp:Transcript_6829/g.18276  ORF Transcript_6829/g.18276 Transcript_6829/m.18276 type:complete len:216 (+) Transcript_6829:127-774(+)